MNDRQTVVTARSRLDGDFLITCGFIVAVAFSQSLISFAQTAVWEPQGLIVKQWLAGGILLVLFVVFYSAKLPLRAAAFRFLRRVGAARLLHSLMPLAPLYRSICQTKTLVILVWLSMVAIVSNYGSPTLRSAALWSTVIALGMPWLLGDERRRNALRILRMVYHNINVGDKNATCLAVRIFLFTAAAAAATWLVAENHRRIAIILALLQAIALSNLAADVPASRLRSLMVFCSAFVAWAMAIGFTSVPLDSWLLGSVPSTAAAPVAFTLAFAAAIYYFAGEDMRPGERSRKFDGLWLLALPIFILLGLRTDDLLADWIPYHRTFWTAPANFIRQGAWPLWDFPSQYGVLSEISLALWPTRTTWQALYLESALIIVAIACLTFWLYTYRRHRFIDRLFALCLTSAAVFSDLGARDPMGARVYPQVGLRFHFVIGIVALSLFLYRFRGKLLHRRIGYAVGHILWALSLAWSLESAIFTGVAWAAYISVDLVIDIASQRVRGVVAIVRRISPVVLIPIVLLSATELVYRSKLGHGPDWLSYIEFSIAYARDPSLLETPFVGGAVWALVLTIAVVGSAAMAALRNRSYDCLPVVAACFAAIWSSSVYYVGEPLEVHVNALAPVIVVTIGALFTLERISESILLLSVSARAALLPLFVLLIAFMTGNPARLAAIRVPLSRTHPLDSTVALPHLKGEVASLLSRAGVKPTDDLILPIPYWSVKLDLGETLPFERDSEGRVVEHIAWLPISPIGSFNTLQTLPYDRRRVYLQRYERDVRRTGWLVAYHRPADCGALLPNLRRESVMRSENYEIARCVQVNTSITQR